MFQDRFGISYFFGGNDDNDFRVNGIFRLSLRVFFCFFLMLLNLTSCCKIPAPNFELFRRPQVMETSHPVVKDYGPVLAEYDERLAAYEDQDDVEKEPLTQDMFKPFKPTEENYHLARGDIVEIDVYDEVETASRNISVAPDGRIYWTFLDGIPAAGRTIPEVRADLEREIKTHFKEPTVTLCSKTTVNETFTILGRVSLPGVYSTVDPIRVREAIGLAGGLLPEDFTNENQNAPQESIADLAHSFLIRDGKKLDVDFHDIFYNPNSKQDVFIYPGDYIYIASTPYAEVYVLGAVTIPTQVRYTRGMRLSQALASSGGWTIGFPYAADISKVLVIRGCLECPLFVQVDLRELINGETRDIVLHPGDIIYVYDKTLRFGRQLVLLALNAFIQSFATAAGSYYGEFSWFHISTGTDSDN